MNGYWSRCTALPINGSECRIARRSPYLHRLARTQVLSRLTDPAFIPLGARQILNLVRKESLPPLAGEGGRRPEGGNTKPAFIPLSVNPAFIPLGEPCIYPAWREPSIYPAWREPRFYPAWRAQHLSRLAGPAFIPLGEPSIYAAWRLTPEQQ